MRLSTGESSYAHTHEWYSPAGSISAKLMTVCVRVGRRWWGVFVSGGRPFFVAFFVGCYDPPSPRL